MNDEMIRNKGFGEAWKNHRLGDVITEFYNGQTPYRGTAEFWNGDVNWLSSGDLNRGIITSTTEKITESGQESANLRTVPKGTVVIAIMGLEAAGVRGNCGILGIDTTINQACMALFPDEQYLTPDFLMQWYQYVGDRYGQIFTQGTKQQNYNAAILSDLSITFPSIPEQKLIGNFLNAFDAEILLNQQKYEKLLLLKQAMLLKMFPHNGATMPEIRFNGFSGEWERRKLGDVLLEFSNKTTVENEYPLLSSTNKGMEYRKGRVSGESNIGYKIIDNNDLVLSPQNLWLGNININTLGKGIVSPSYKTYKITNAEVGFFAPQIRTPHMLHEYMLASTQGASVVRRNFEPELFRNIEMLFPTIEEQCKIGVLFSRLEYLIALHQSKIEKVKHIKQSLVSRMFA